MSLIDLLYIKRFCLPCNVDLSKLFQTKNFKQTNLCSLNAYNHIACILSDGKIILKPGEGILLRKTNILSFGVNTYGDLCGTTPGVHAEIDAINKLSSNTRKNTIVNLLVVRLSSNNKIQNSKPCNNCIQKMNYLIELKGYKLKHVYYSDNDEKIIKTKLSSLKEEDQHVSKYYRRNRL
jgi:cytidine deaminase